MTTRSIVWSGGPSPAYIAESANRSAVVGASYVKESVVPSTAVTRTIVRSGGPSPAYVAEDTARTALIGASYVSEVTATPSVPVLGGKAFGFKSWLLRTMAHGVAPAAAASFSLTVNARRTSGVAPLNVHFDATPTSSTSESDTYRKVWYEWDFGETTGPGVAAWTFGIQNRTRNTAHGPIAAHLYETPGTYTATCTAYYNGAAVGTPWTQTITVTDPAVVYSGKTMQYSNSGVGSGTQIVTSSWDTVLSTITSKGAGWRHQINRGDTFLMAADSTESTNNISLSDLLVNAYGSGAKPVLGLTSTAASSGNVRALFQFGRQSSLPARCTVMDMTVDGSTASSDRECDAVGAYTATDLTLVRVTAKTCQMVFRSTVLQDKYNVNLGSLTHPLYDGLAIWDCDVLSPKDTTTGSPPYCVYFAANYYAIQGCNFDLNAGANANRTHVIRQTHGYKGVVANNLLRGSGQGRHCLKLHSETQFDVEIDYAFAGQTWALSVYGLASPSGGKTDYVWACDNDIESTWTSTPVAFGPPSTSGDDSGTRLYHIGFTGNRIKSGANGAFEIGVGFWAQSGLVANNLFSITTSTGGRHLCVHTGTRGTVFGGADGVDVLPADDCIVENNSGYIATASTGVSMFLYPQSNCTNITLKNNILWSPNDSGASIASGLDTATGVAITAAGYTASNNSTNAQCHQVSAPFASSTPATLANFVPTGYPLNAGTPVKLQKDINSLTRSLSTPDMGAVEV